MKELLKRLFSRPFLAAEILVATFFIALLNLASPVFVINVLNRYITYGFDGTLITLTSGMLIAVALQFGFRVSRTKMLGPISAGPDMDMSHNILGVLTGARIGAVNRFSNARIQETVGGLQAVQSAYDASSYTAFLDAPFSIIYVVATFFLSPILAFIALAGILVALAVGAVSLKLTRRTTESLQKVATAHRGTIFSATQSGETVRVFKAKNFLSGIWKEHIGKMTFLRLKLADRKEQSQSITQAANLLMSVALYTVGAVLVVRGSITVGALIGANILASRSFQNVVKFVQNGYQLHKAKEAEQQIREFANLPLEPDSGTALKQYQGGLTFKDVGFAYPGSAGPLFESLNLDLKPGSILVVIGKNGVGKTTLARLIVGLLFPPRGEILSDGISLRQIAQGWWRNQICYFPQEPTFINGTIRENITMIRPDIEDAELNPVIKEADLRNYTDRTPRGLDAPIVEGGRHLSLGIRRRIALARSLVTKGMLVIFDEPTEGLDAEGCEAVYGILNNLTKEGRTIVAFSNDPRVIKGAHYILDLNEKPVPKILNNVP